MVDYAWSHQPALAIVPFEDLDPRWKVLPVDGLSPIHKNIDLANYRLKIPISLNSDPDRAALIQSNFSIPPSNLDPQKMTTVVVTGVTALVRATAYTMEKRGMLYPAQDIRDLLLDADITHISNEVPFAVDCPDPNPNQQSMRFCSKDEYIQLLEDVGTDVVELTGDHFADWGTDAMVHTLDMYKQRGWLYYGGGANLDEGRKALLIENNGNQIAFIGCNAKGPAFAQASETQPGAVLCDMDWMANEIRRLKSEGYLVIATFQHAEYYTYIAQPDQLRDFRQMAEAGADIVSGSQAHQPQAMEFLNGSFIHYGLGNLFFDQYGLCDACRLGLIDRHVFYNGRYISTELLPIEFVDYARSIPMTVEEANSLFQTLFRERLAVDVSCSLPPYARQRGQDTNRLSSAIIFQRIRKLIYDRRRPGTGVGKGACRSDCRHHRVQGTGFPRLPAAGAGRKRMGRGPRRIMARFNGDPGGRSQRWRAGVWGRRSF